MNIVLFHAQMIQSPKQWIEMMHSTRNSTQFSAKVNKAITDNSQLKILTQVCTTSSSQLMSITNIRILRTSNFGMFLLVPPSNASTGKNAIVGPLMSTKKFCT